jgi:peptide/nickel transport system substrate-binding protein
MTKEVKGPNRRTTMMVAAAFAATLAAGAVPVQAQGTPTRGGSLNVGFPSDSKTLDPTFSVQFTERQVLYTIFNTLVRYEPDFSIKPELAESWAIEDEGKRIVFKLRAGVKFHDGTAFDAEAVKWNIDRRLDKDVASPQRAQLEPIIAAVRVLDPLTVAFDLKQRSPGLLSLLGERPGFMISPSAGKKFGQDLGNNPVGTGPFMFKEWVKGSHINVERNPNYWEPGKPYLDRIAFKDIAGSVVGVQRLITGDLDFVGDLSPQEIKAVAGRSGLKLYPITVGRWYSLQWHMYEPPFDNAKLRQAIAHGIDRKRINDIVMDGKGALIDGPTPDGLWWFNPDAKAYPYDPAKAKALLAEAGYPNGFSYTLSTPQIGVFQQINQLVQEQLAAIGIALKLEPVAQSEWYDRLVKRATNMSPNRWTQRPDPDGLLYILFHSKGFANTTGYNNPRVDNLLEQARNTYDQAARRKLYDELQEILVKDIPMLSLFYSVEYGVLRDSVQGFVWIPDQIPRFRDLWKK